MLYVPCAAVAHVKWLPKACLLTADGQIEEGAHARASRAALSGA